MMQDEWLKLTKQPFIPEDDWEIIHTVYQWHPLIPEVDGKKVMLKFYKQGGLGLIKGMLPAAKEAERLYQAYNDADVNLSIKTGMLQEAEEAVRTARQERDRAGLAMRQHKAEFVPA